MQDYLENTFYNQMIIHPNDLDSVITFIGHYTDNGVEEAIVVPGPLPRLDDPRVTDYEVYTPASILGGHCVAIGASTKHKDAVVRLIEVLVSDEVGKLASWGIEGVDYTMEGGQMKFTSTSMETFNLRRMYGFMYTYGSDKLSEIFLDMELQKVNPSIRDEYAACFKEGMKIAFEEQSKGSINPISFMKFSDEYYEAACIDGAGRMRQIWHITLPGIKKFAIVLLILQIGGMTTIGFEQIFLLYNPMVYNVGDVISTYTYRLGIEQFRYSLTTAIGFTQSIVNFLLVYSTNILSRKIAGWALW